MEYRQLGRSGLKVPELCFGCGTFGGSHEFFDAWGATSDVAEARKMVDICMEAGLNFFDTADVYSDGRSETVLGGAIQHLRAGTQTTSLWPLPPKAQPTSATGK